MTRRQGRGVIETAPATPERCVLGFGSNLGDRGETIAAALRDVAALPGVDLLTVSPVYESIAVTLEGPDPEAPRYLNGVAALETTLSPLVLLQELHTIEERYGRVRAARWGSRTLDLDILDFGGRLSSDPELTLPHPRLAERSFVVVPWLDIDSGADVVGVGPLRDLPAAEETLTRADS